ncbi:DUF1707 SHOCT-like domain-containing protein [Streptomyces mangrovi]|uniref:DUF1707 SHOCT-like domain-containing protein n=1 Tax=Streptomyces mangrovi TaxID=1206892 RepID=UPI00399C5FFE
MDEKTSLRKQPAARPSTASPADVRASDADRDRVAEILREALAQGRLDADEHAERIESVYRARTVGELRPLVRDLPAGREAAPPSSRPASGGDGDSVIAVFGGASRKGRRRVGARTNAFALFGGIEIDLTEALFERRELVVNATAVFGGIEIKVPENVTLRGSGSGIMGGYDVEARESEDPDAPVVVVRGVAVFGGVEAKAERGKRLRDLRR